MVLLVYWDLKVCILLIQFYHPVCLLNYVWQNVETFHLKALTKLLRPLRFMTGLSYPPPFFSTRKIWETKLSRES